MEHKIVAALVYLGKAKKNNYNEAALIGYMETFHNEMCDCEDVDDEFQVIVKYEEIFNKKEYSLYLFEAWVKWRALYQFGNGGSSKFSKIDNKFYDSKRKEIANVIFNYISKHKKDKMAINQFLVLASHDIIKIHGEYPYGNQNVVEFHSFFE